MPATSTVVGEHGKEDEARRWCTASDAGDSSVLHGGDVEVEEDEDEEDEEGFDAKGGGAEPVAFDTLEAHDEAWWLRLGIDPPTAAYRAFNTTFIELDDDSEEFDIALLARLRCQYRRCISLGSSDEHNLFGVAVTLVGDLP